MSRVLWSGPVEEVPCNEDGACMLVYEYGYYHQHAFCYGYDENNCYEKCPFYGLKEGTIVRMEVD